MSKPSNGRGARVAAPKRKKKRVWISGEQPKPREDGRINNNWRLHFLRHLAETSNVAASAEFANISPSHPYKVRREDPEFGAKWRAALLEGYEHLELEVLGYLRAADPGRKMDVAGALKLLALHAQTVAHERALADNRDEQEVLDSIDAMIDEMRERAAANEAEIARSADNDDEEA